VEKIRSVRVDTRKVNLQAPFVLSATSDGIVITEQEQLEVTYGQTERSHAALVRYKSISDPAAINDRNAIDEYNGIRFTPLLRSIQ